MRLTLTQVIAAALVGGLHLISTPVYGQGATGISGVVRDTSGAVLPGVTVEASSQALIEKARTVTTDGAGLYTIVDLRPGEYAVTFSLQGFATVRREGVALTDGFTATVNVELRLGSIEETITVSGDNPLVDLHNVTQQETLSRDVLESVPMGKRYQSMATLIPGVNTSQFGDPGGQSGFGYAQLTIHGSAARDQTILVDGMNIATASRNDVGLITLQDSTTDQYSFQTAAQSADVETSGVRVNLVPREGGNDFKGIFTADFLNSSIQASNVTSDLLARGLGTPNRTKSQWDVNPAFGGPIRRNRVWFFAGIKRWTTDNYVGGTYLNATPNTFVYTPDLSRPAIDDSHGLTGSLRLTGQATQRNKLTVMETMDYTCNCHILPSFTRTPENSAYTQVKMRSTQVSWTSPISQRVLVDVSGSTTPGLVLRDRQRGVTIPQITELATGQMYGAAPTGTANGNREDGANINVRGSVSYVTGTHALKIGLDYHYMKFLVHKTVSPVGDYILGQEAFTILNGVPKTVTYYATPNSEETYTNALGTYVQDQWKVRRLTATGGLRLDTLTSGYRAVSIPASNLVAERDFPGGHVFDWKDLNPRLGATYDLFGNGRTALKVGLNRFIQQEGPGEQDYTSPAAPTTTSSIPSTRTWTDSNGDYVVQGDPTNPAANGELGKASNASFGSVASTTTYDPAWQSGWGKRRYNWETSAGIQQQLGRNASVGGAYFRRSYGNFIATYNQAIPAAANDPYCITSLIDQRLPGGGGQQLCGLFDPTPSKFGQIQNLVTDISDGRQRQTWNGYDITATAKLKGGAMIQGGVSSGKTVTDNCAVASQLANPIALFCHTETPFLTQLTAFGFYPLPWWGFQASASFQSVPGAPVMANYVATNAVIAPSLGRNLAAGPAATVTINLVAPGTMYLDRWNEVDMRGSKTFAVAGRKIQLNLDAYNLLNSNTVLAVNNSYGTNGKAWLTPQRILPGRLFRVSTQINF